MAVREIPAEYVHKCDVCGREERTNSRSIPSTWGKAAITFVGLDFQGQAVGGGTNNHEFCHSCQSDVMEMFRGGRHGA